MGVVGARAMQTFSVTSRGLPAVEVQAINWITALGQGLHALGRDAQIARLACELLPNGTVIARDIESGAGYIIHAVAGVLSDAATVATEELQMLSADSLLPLDDESLVGDTITGAETDIAACRAALAAAQALLPAESGAVLLESEGYLRFMAVSGPHAHRLDGVRLALGTGVAGFAMARRRTAVIDDAHEDPRHCGDIDVLTGYVTREICVVPLMVGQRALGVLELMNRTDGKRFDEDDVVALQGIANTLSTRLARG